MGSRDDIDWGSVEVLLGEIESPRAYNAIVRRIAARFPSAVYSEHDEPREPSPFQTGKEVRRGEATSLDQALELALASLQATPLVLVGQAAAERRERVLARVVEVAFRDDSDATFALEELVEAIAAAELPMDFAVEWIVKIGRRGLSLEFPAAVVAASLIGLARVGAITELEMLFDVVLASEEAPVDHTGDLPSKIPFAGLAKHLDAVDGPRIWSGVLAAAERCSDAFVVSDLLGGLSRLPPEQVRPLLTRMAECTRTMEPIHRKPGALIDVANAQLAVGDHGEELFELAMTHDMPLSVWRGVPNAKNVSRASKLLQRARGYFRVGAGDEARHLCERAFEIGRPSGIDFPRTYACLGFFDLAAAALPLVEERMRRQARLLVCEVVDALDGDRSCAEPLVVELLAHDPPSDARDVQVALSLARGSARAWRYAFAHRAVAPHDSTREQLIETRLDLPPR